MPDWLWIAAIGLPVWFLLLVSTGKLLKHQRLKHTWVPPTPDPRVDIKIKVDASQAARALREMGDEIDRMGR